MTASPDHENGDVFMAYCEVVSGVRIRIENLQEIILKITDKLFKNWSTQKITIVKSLIPIHTASDLESVNPGFDSSCRRFIIT